MGVPHCLDAHDGRAKVKVKVIEGRVRSIILFDFESKTTPKTILRIEQELKFYKKKSIDATF